MENSPARQPVVIPFPAPGDEANRPAALPRPLTPLLGRERDLAEVVGLLTRGETRLVTLSGAPGIGKTRLALAAAERWRETTGAAVQFVPLASVSDPSLVLPAVAHAFGVSRAPGTPLLRTLAHSLSSDPTLLVLDNFEHVVAAAPEVVELLAACPALTVLVTSRAVLRVRGEQEWEVPPLAVPPLASHWPLPALAACPAVALLLDRGRAVDAQLSLTLDNAEVLAAICVQLEGIPLAIELAAPWLKVFSPSALLERLERRLTLLRGGARDLPARQRTLEDALAWSDQLLAPEERVLLHGLAVFVNGWTLAAAEAVVGGGGAGAGTTVGLLSALLDKSLIRRVPETGGAPRFRMLAMVREYALAQLELDDQGDRVRERHAAHYFALVEEAAPHLHAADQSVWMDRLSRELGNLRAALRWLIERGDVERALRMAAGLDNFWLVRDHLREGPRWLEEILAMAGAEFPALQARARSALAALLVRRGDYHRLRPVYEANLAYARAFGDEGLRAEILMHLGSLHLIEGASGPARSYFEEALLQGRRLGDRRTMARALNKLGEVARSVGDDGVAAARYAESLAICRDLGESERIAMVLHNLGPVTARLGRRRQALELLGESLGISWDLQNTHGAAICLASIAGVVADGGERAAPAAQLLGAADGLRASVGVQWEPVDQAEYERGVTAVRGWLDESTFAVAWEQGRALTLREAIELAGGLIAAATEPPPAAAAGARVRRPGGLSRREHEVALRVALGETNREIADVLSIAEKTVEMHVSHSLDKLGLRSRVQLAAWVASQRAGQGASAGEIRP